MTKISIHFGALCDPIKDQLLRQGVDLPESEVNALQLDAQSISRLSLRGLLSDSEAEKARKRLMKRVAKACDTR